MILTSSIMCALAFNNLHEEVSRKVDEIACKAESLPRDKYQLGYLRGQYDAYLYVYDLLERSVDDFHN